jgi:hypothetical protein
VGGGTFIPFRDLLGAANLQEAQSLIPGSITTLDATGDIAVDGGSSPYTPDDSPPYGGEPVLGSGNVLDGFTMRINNFDENEILSLNWYLLGQDRQPIGTASGGNSYGFGTINLHRVPLGETEGPPILKFNNGLPANRGMTQSPTLFYDSIYTDNQNYNFVGEFGADNTAPFRNPRDRKICAGGCVVNDPLIGEDEISTPEPSSLLFLFAAPLLGSIFKQKHKSI